MVQYDGIFILITAWTEGEWQNFSRGSGFWKFSILRRFKEQLLKLCLVSDQWSHGFSWIRLTFLAIPFSVGASPTVICRRKRSFTSITLFQVIVSGLMSRRANAFFCSTLSSLGARLVDIPSFSSLLSWIGENTRFLPGFWLNMQ